MVYAAPAGTAIGPGPAPGGGRRWSCGWYRIHGGPLPVVFSHLDPTPSTPVPGHVYWFACWDGPRPESVAAWSAAGTVYGDFRLYEPGVPAPPGVPPTASDIATYIVDQALVDPRPPSMELNPQGVQIVHVDTWLHVVDDWTIAPVTAHAGGIEATVHAVAQGLWFDPGDGGEVVYCPTRGVRYDPTRPATEQATDCAHTYTRSQDAPYTAAATVRWSVTWTSNTGEGGTLPDIVETTPLAVTVRQLQPVIN